MVVLQVIKPFLQRCGGHAIEFVDADDEVLREYLRGTTHANRITVFGTYLKHITRMDAAESGSADGSLLAISEVS